MIWVATKVLAELASEFTYWGIKTGASLTWYAGGVAYRALYPREEEEAKEDKSTLEQQQRQMAKLRQEVCETNRLVKQELIELHKLRQTERRRRKSV